jgi:very-short-patch-repair endonuclease
VGSAASATVFVFLPPLRFGEGGRGGEVLSEPIKNIIVGQSVSSDKVARSRELRRDMTPAERLMWERLRAHRLHGLRFRRQQIIDGYIADFYCHATAVVVEIDGPVHERREDFDRGRDLAFRQRGLTVLRVTNDEVRNDLEGVLRRIAAACGKG